MLGLEQQSQIDEPSAQVLQRIEIEKRQITVQKQTQFDPTIINKQTSRIVGDSFKNPILTYSFAIIFVMLLCVAIGIAMRSNTYNYFTSKQSTGLSCDNPSYFDSNEVVKCKNFNFMTHPTIGLFIQQTTKFNQYLDIRFLATQTYHSTNPYVSGKLSIYSIQKDNNTKQYKKKQIIVQDQQINIKADDRIIYYSDFSQNIWGYVADVHTVHKIQHSSYLVVFKLNINDISFLKSSSDIELSTQYISTTVTNSIFAIRIMCVIILFFFIVYYRCNINKENDLVEEVKKEQKQIFYFSICQLIGLDPFLILTHTQHNIVSDVFSSIFLTIQIASFLLIALHFFENYVKIGLSKIFQISFQVILVVLTGLYVFFGTFTYWDKNRGEVTEIVYFVFICLILVSATFILYIGFQIMFNFGTQSAKSTTFFIHTQVMLIGLLIAIVVFEYGIYSLYVVGICMPLIFTIYTISMLMMFRIYVQESDENETDSEIQNHKKAQLQNVQNHQPKELDNQQNLEYFDIEGTEQFSQISDNITGI